MFTKNRVVAAPLEVGRASLAASRGRVRAVIVNSGNANCATGKAGNQGLPARFAAKLAQLLETYAASEIFPSSTGIIGVPLPVEKICPALPELAAAREATQAGNCRLRPRHHDHRYPAQVGLRDAFVPERSSVNLLGIAKGAGMIHPQLATMLVYLFTDAVGQSCRIKATAC